MLWLFMQYLSVFTIIMGVNLTSMLMSEYKAFRKLKTQL